jgi:hypothetical protein
MKKRKQCLYLISFLCLVLINTGTPAVEAATYYVATTGNDASPGTVSLPFSTIRKGISVLRAGDTLFIRGGTYGESINSNAQTIPSGTSWSDAPVIAGYPGETVILKPSGCNIVNLSSPSLQYLVFKNLVLDGVNLTSSISFSCEDIAMGSGGSTINHIRFQDLEVKNSPANGIAARGTYIEFLNLHVHHNGMGAQQVGYAPGANGIYGVAANSVVRGGNYHDNLCYGVRFFDSGTVAPANDNVIEGAWLYANGKTKAFNGISACGSGGGGIILGDRRNTARNNVISNNWHGIGVVASGSTTDTTNIFNNTMYGNVIGLSMQSQPVTNTSAINNIIYGNSTNTYDVYTQLKTSTSNLNSNPGFINETGNDFRLQTGSIAIDSGVAIGSIVTDYSGKARPQGAGYDIGAHEFGSISSIKPPQNLMVR